MLSMRDANEDMEALSKSHAELLAALKGYHRAAQKQGWAHNYPIEFKASAEAIANAEKVAL